MPWVRANLHGQVVFARANSDGSLLVQGNRVEVCYSLNASRLYKARASNVVKEAGSAIYPDEARSPRAESGGRLKKAPPVATVTKRRTQSTSMPKAPKDSVIAYADGACSGNPG